MNIKITNIAILFFAVVISSVTSVAVYHHFFIKDAILDDYSSKARLIAERDVMLSDRFLQAMKSSSPTDFIAAADRCREAVVFIKSDAPLNTNSSYAETNTGSGVIMSFDGYIMTNHHVVKDANAIEVTMNDNRVFAARLVGVDASTDLALLKIDTDQAPFITLGNSDSLRVGEWVMAIGNPFRLQSTVTAGIVSAKARNISILENSGIESFIQTDAAMNPGSSGGALVNTFGDLVGISTAVVSNSGRYEGFSFAVPSNIVQKVFHDIKTYGVVQRGWLGLDIENVTQEIASGLRLDRVAGVYISSVHKGGGANEAGLVADDVILAVDQFATSQVSEFMEQIGRHKPGDQVNLTIVRNGRKQSILATLKNRLNSEDLVDAPFDAIVDKLGLELRALDKSERSKINFDGIMVESVKRGSPVGNARMEPGYIISSINDTPIKSVDQCIQMIRKNTGKSIVMKGVYLNYPGQYPYTFVVPETK